MHLTINLLKTKAELEAIKNSQSQPQVETLPQVETQLQIESLPQVETQPQVEASSESLSNEIVVDLDNDPREVSVTFKKRKFNKKDIMVAIYQRESHNARRRKPPTIPFPEDPTPFNF